MFQSMIVLATQMFWSGNSHFPGETYERQRFASLGKSVSLSRFHKQRNSDGGRGRQGEKQVYFRSTPTGWLCVYSKTRTILPTLLVFLFWCPDCHRLLGSPGWCFCSRQPTPKVTKPNSSRAWQRWGSRCCQWPELFPRSRTATRKLKLTRR